jgi:chromosome segregation ATPase
MNDETKEVLRALARVQDYLGQLPDLIRELSTLSEKFPPILRGQEEEIAKLDRQIAEKQETDAFKLSEKLADLQKKVAEAQLRHTQLEQSERSLRGRLSDIRERVEKASEGFKLSSLPAEA